MRVRDLIFAVGMLAAGTINTIASKLQDEIHSVGLPGSGSHPFQHPAVQTLAMFIGETLCILAFLVVIRQQRQHPENVVEKGQKFPIWTFGLPAMCDMTATTLMYVGLLMTYPSVYQMLRGMIVVCTGFLSWMFLNKKLFAFHIVGMGLIVVGTAIVGVSSIVNHDDKSTAPNPLLGDILVVGAQLVAAVQMVVEEKFIGKYNVHPLQVVGNEGMWGAAVTTIVLFILYWIPPVRNVDNSMDAAYQIKNNMFLVGALLGSIFSISFFNFFGISVTKYLSATHRTTIDASRVFLVWLVSLLIGWERFEWLQLLGFFVLLAGTAMFNEIYRLPFFFYPSRASQGKIEHEVINEKRGLLEDKEKDTRWQ